jgi:hypothetical protein
MTTLPDVIGQPPVDSFSENMINNSLPIMEVIPQKPHFEMAATLFKLTPDWTKYENLLKKHKFSLSGRPIKLAFIADNFPTDSFTNQYSESFLNKFTDVVSSGAAELSQMTGERNAKDAISRMLDSLAASDVGIVSAIGEGAKTGLGAISAGFQGLTAGMGKAGTYVRNVANLTGKLLGGARVDMPLIWKNSGFTPSYTITVRLYNPQPSNQTMKEKYIIGPIAAILSLALPQTDDGTFYNWPFFCTIKVPGLLYIPSAYIGNVTVIKGGDQLQIAYSQEMGMVDVRIEFGSLYDTMIAGKTYKSTSRPTLENYLDNMREKRGVSDPNPFAFVGSDMPLPNVLESDANLRLNQGTVDVTSEPSDRVSTQDSNDASLLLINQPII